MKRFTLLFLVLTLATTTAFAYDFTNGSGTGDDPYEIANIADLLGLSEDNLAWDKHFIQTSDIDASSTLGLNEDAGFSPIGNESTNFTGSYNGNNQTISNLYINRPNSSYIGLFGFTNGAIITNVSLTDVDVSGHISVGALVGFSDNNSVLTNCYSSGTLMGMQSVGGLIGYIDDHSEVNDCSALCEVNGNFGLGGLVGESQDSNISNSYAEGSIGTEYGFQVSGGLVGNATNSAINNCYASGFVSGFSNLGGLIGQTENSTITNSYATGSMSGLPDIPFHGNYGGGLIGLGVESTITNCYATGAVSGIEVIGGLVGCSNGSTIKNSYAIGLVNNGVAGLNVGGFLGLNVDGRGRTRNSFWDAETSGQATSDGGSGKTTEQMQTRSTYITRGWDFFGEDVNGSDDVWSFIANDYPHLSMEELFITDFMVSRTTIYVSESIDFLNLSTCLIDEYLWTFGDSNTSTEARPTHTYSQAGLYSVTLTITNADNTDSITKTDFITVSLAPNIIVDAAEFTATLTAGDSATQNLTISNNGAGILEASLRVGTDTSSERTAGYSLLYISALLGEDSDLRTELSNLSNVSLFEEYNAEYDTPTVANMLEYDLVVVVSGDFFSNPTLMGNNLASYSDAGGKLLVLGNCFGAGGNWVLKGAIVNPEYLPLTVAEYTHSTDASGTNFIFHPLTRDISEITTTLFTHTATQGDGVSLGSYTNGYPVVAYNPHKPIVAINVWPSNGEWGGDFVQMISNSINWLADDYEWIALSESNLSIAPGGSETIAVTLNSETLEAGVYPAAIMIFSNDLNEGLLNIPVTLTVLERLKADFSVSNYVLSLGESVEFTNISTGIIDQYSWNFGDGNTSTEANPIHTYEAVGMYSVTLSISGVAGSDSITKVNYVVVQQEALSAPQNPSITISGTSINLAWSEVTETALGAPVANPSYLIYSSAQPLGNYNFRDSVSSLNWTDENIQQADKQFYIIVAFFGSSKASLEEYINSHRYITRDGEVIQAKKIKR